MPNNWLHVALISLILPNAKIIDVRRNPMDCCVSNFKQHFARGQHFSYSLSEVGEFYCAYLHAMNDAQIARPEETFYRLHYESLVNDIESETRSLLEFSRHTLRTELYEVLGERCVRFKPPAPNR